MDINYAGYIIKEMNYRIFENEDFNGDSNIVQEKLDINLEAKLHANRDLSIAFVELNGNIKTFLIDAEDVELKKPLRNLNLTIQFNFDIETEKEDGIGIEGKFEYISNEMRKYGSPICEYQFKEIVRNITSIDYLGRIELPNIKINS